MPINWPARLCTAGNADFIEDLYERFLKDPAAVDPAWARVLPEFARRAGGDRSAHRQIRERSGGQAAQRLPVPRGATRRRRRGGKRQAGGGVAADSDLCESRPSDRQSGSARAAAARQALCARSGILRSWRCGSGYGILHRQPQSRRSPSAPSCKDILATLKFIYTDTIGAEFAHVSDTEERLWLQDQFQVGAHAASLQRRGEEKHSLAADRRRRAGALPAHQVRGPEALLARGRRQPHPAARRSGAAGRQGRRRGDHHRHGASRPPQRAGEPARQVAEGSVQRIRGSVRPRRSCAARATSSITRDSPPT